jgi:hypothetical protein
MGQNIKKPLIFDSEYLTGGAGYRETMIFSETLQDESVICDKKILHRNLLQRGSVRLQNRLNQGPSESSENRNLLLTFPKVDGLSPNFYCWY